MGGTLAITIAAVTGFEHMTWLVLVIILYRLAIDYLIYPMLISSSMALHPLYVMFGVFSGERLGGIVGAFFALPALAILRILFRHLVLRQRTGRKVLLSDDPDADGTANESLDDDDVLGQQAVYKAMTPTSQSSMAKRKTLPS